jgi:PilZ domain
MSAGDSKTHMAQARYNPRINGLREISVNYEGHDERIAVRPPDISAHGMFINTTRIFPEGAVLSLRFRLGISAVEVETRCEVRYCLPGVGVGVEFVGISPAAVRSIESEIELWDPATRPGRRAARRTKPRRATRRSR